MFANLLYTLSLSTQIGGQSITQGTEGPISRTEQTLKRISAFWCVTYTTRR